MKFKYRSEIDGLRAIAVISVIIYHAEFTIRLNNVSYKVFPGGFLGVDIFYVISGYLITYLIYENIKKNSFLFLDFYERRARRLLPMLFLVISMSLIAGWMLMMPNQLKDFSGSALASLFFVSNFWFLITDSYFAESSTLKPLLHTWSLSIEEQFYIIFPPFLYFLYKKKIRQIKLLFVVLILISLSLATLGSFYFTDINFYILLVPYYIIPIW
jgi:peptidoglycan/LPS O-acetylase OafA/YrhL